MHVKFLRVVKLEDAKNNLEKQWRPTPHAVSVDIDDAFGLTLAEKIVSPNEIPPFDRAVYDGFAVRASDTFGADEGNPKSLKLIGRLKAGTRPMKKIRRGECMEIATGAPVPQGANSTVMSEYATVEGKNVFVRRAVAPGENVAARGSDIRRGQVVANAGKSLNIRDIGAIVAVGIKRARVFSKPKVAVISTGSELLEPGQRLKPAKVYDVNSFTLSQAVKACGAEPVRFGIVADNQKSINSVLEKSMKACDVVLLSGGTSAGRGDLIPNIVAKISGLSLLVHGLALKPGKPTFIAVVDGKPIFGLPGYPVSALMMFEQLVAPYLREFSGSKQPERTSVRVKLATKIISARGRRELVPVKLVERKGGLQAVAIQKGSGAIVSLSAADGYIDVPLEREIVEEGEMVEVKLFGGGHRD